MHKYSHDFPREISWMNKNGSRQIVNSPHSGSICFSQPEALKRIAQKLKDRQWLAGKALLLNGRFGD